MVSVVIPSYNQGRFLDRALRSVVEQDYDDKEIIVLDGGSQDDSVRVIKKYEPHLTFWRSGPDDGQAAALCEGFERCSGTLIGWLNSDDELAPGAMKRLHRAARARGGAEGVYFGGFEVIDSDGVVQEIGMAAPVIPWVVRRIGPVICQPGTFFSRSAYQRVGGLDASLKYSMDFDLWMRLYAANVPLVRIRAVQGKFRQHPLQKGHSVSWLEHAIGEQQLIIQRYRMAPSGSLQRFLAREIKRATAILGGSALRTLGYRMLFHRRLRQFGVAYSS